MVSNYKQQAKKVIRELKTSDTIRLTVDGAICNYKPQRDSDGYWELRSTRPYGFVWDPEVRTFGALKKDLLDAVDNDKITYAEIL